MNHLAEKCKHCHLFIEENWGSSGPGVAPYIHLTRGDDADELLETHDAEPSDEVATLAVWQRYGPLEMRLRFTDNNFTDQDVMTISRMFEVHSPEADIGVPGVGYVVINSDSYAPAQARALAAVLQERADFAETQAPQF